jgi:hypothetical protein
MSYLVRDTGYSGAWRNHWPNHHVRRSLGEGGSAITPGRLFLCRGFIGCDPGLGPFLTPNPPGSFDSFSQLLSHNG